MRNHQSFLDEQQDCSNKAKRYNASGDAYEERVARMEVRGEWEAVDRFHQRVVVVKNWGNETPTETIGPKF